MKLGLGDEYLFVVYSSVVVTFWPRREFVESWLKKTTNRRFVVIFAA